MPAAARPVDASTSFAAISHASSLRDAITTAAPASAYACTMARPIPRLPPVTTATFPLRSNWIIDASPSRTRPHRAAAAARAPPYEHHGSALVARGSADLELHQQVV